MDREVQCYLRAHETLTTQRNNWSNIRRERWFVLLKLIGNTFWTVPNESSGNAYWKPSLSSCITCLLLGNKPVSRLMVSISSNHFIINHGFWGSGIQEDSSRLTCLWVYRMVPSASSWSWNSRRLEREACAGIYLSLSLHVVSRPPVGSFYTGQLGPHRMASSPW